ncbi:MAG: 1-deoxy-D-xylulose-5-phosphate reductoisomerase, partial [Planctomycetota bacterium]
ALLEPSGHPVTAGAARRIIDRGSPTRRVVILGSTGSVGTQAVDAVAHLNDLHEQGRFPHRYEVVGLAAGSNGAVLAEQAERLDVPRCALAHDPQDHARSISGGGRSVRVGPDAAESIVRETHGGTGCDLVLGAIVGAAGLDSVLSALELGIDVALANKETLVAAGSIVIPAARASGARILPVDSEHAGVWQCLMQAMGPGFAPPDPVSGDIARIVLTASGGAFRDYSPEQVAHATPDQALAHPTWDMGAKVTVDTATLVNKALELIEAHWLFGIGADRLDAVIHPTSTVHAMVEMGDGTVVAQMGATDMRTPILRAIAHPHRSPTPITPMDPTRLGGLEFRPIEGGWRRAIDLGMWAMRSEGDAGAVFNASNEVAVNAFLEGRIPFGKILDIVESVCGSHTVRPLLSVGDVRRADREARARAKALLPD